MPLDDILAAIRRRPLVPFRLVMLDGATYEIHHPELILPGARSLVIGIPADPSQPYYQRAVTAALLIVCRLEPLPPSQVSGNGEQ
jgi:hypothetical protein